MKKLLDIQIVFVEKVGVVTFEFKGVHGVDINAMLCFALICFALLCFSLLCFVCKISFC